MYASTTLPVILLLLGQTDTTDNSNAFTIQPVQTTPLEAPSFYGTEPTPVAIPQKPATATPQAKSVYGGIGTTPQQPTGNSIYGNPSAFSPAPGQAGQAPANRIQPPTFGTQPADIGGPTITDRSPAIGSSFGSISDTPANDINPIAAPQLDGPPSFGGSPFRQVDPKSANPTISNTSPNIARTSAETPLTPIVNRRDRSAENLLTSPLQVPAGNELTGKSITLEQAIGRTNAEAGRRAAIIDYWQLAVAVRQYYLAVQESRFLIELPIPQSTHNKALLHAAQSTAVAEQSKARLAALLAQHDLAESAAMALTELPLPSDAPFAGTYRTHFETLRTRNAVPEQMRRVHNTLPLMLELIDTQATAVIASEQAVKELYQGYSTGQVSLAALLDSHSRLKHHRRQFLGSVSQYNQRIAEYALTVASGRLNNQKIVGMLIENPSGQSSVLARNRNRTGIQRVSNEESINQSPQTAFPR